MNNCIKIDILFTTSTVRNKELNGETVNLNDYTIEQVVFYSIHNIQPFIRDGVELSRITSGVDSFISPHTANEVAEMIRLAIEPNV